MFELSQTAFGPFRRYTLHNPDTGMGFSIVPEAGATLLELNFAGIQVLDGYQTPEALQEGKWGKSALLFPFPNRLRDGIYHWQEKAYRFPVNNAATANAIHGFARHEAFQVTRIELTTESAEISCSLDYPGQHPAYPFPLFLEVSFNMTNRNEFNLSCFVRNKHSGPIPVGFGWHPYFQLDGPMSEWSLQLPPCDRVEIDERMLPTGRETAFTPFASETRIGDTQLDNCFRSRAPHNPYHLILRNGNHGVSLTASSNLFPYFQIFTPPARESIALEPMTCNIDAFNNQDGLLTLAPGADWRGAFRVEFLQFRNTGNRQ